MNPAPQPVVVFAEADYCYGSGPLIMRIEHLEHATPVWYDGENWFYVEGMEVDRNGRELAPRRVLVRGSRLPGQPRARG